MTRKEYERLQHELNVNYLRERMSQDEWRTASRELREAAGLERGGHPNPARVTSSGPDHVTGLMSAGDFLESIGSSMSEAAEAQELIERATCAECGEPVTEEELQRVASDVDFVEHGDRGHLIRLEA